MATLTEIVAAREDALRTEDEKKLWSDDLHAHTQDGKTDDIPIDYEIQATLDHLKRLKFQNIGLRTKELFLQKVLDSTSVDNTFPTTQELAKLELSLGREKTKLRSIKAERADSEKRLEEAATNVSDAIAERDSARSEIETVIRNAKAASQLEDVKKALESGQDDALERLIGEIDQLDAACCEHIVTALRKQKEELEREANEQSRRSDNLREEVEALEAQVSHMERESEALQAQISKNDKQDEDSEKLRSEWKLQGELAELLSALVGVRIVSDRDNGMTVEINDSVFAMPLPGSTRQSQPTHTLDIEFGINSVGETIIAHMRLSPSDVDVTDIVEDMNLSLEKGMQKLFSRFMRLKEQQMNTGV